MGIGGPGAARADRSGVAIDRGGHAWYRGWLPTPAVASRGVDMLGVADEEERGIRRRRRIGWVFAAIWAVYLIDPLQHAWALGDPAARIYTLAVIFAYGVCYVLSYGFLTRGTARTPWPPTAAGVRLVLLPIILQGALIGAAAVTLGFEATGLAVYIASFIAFTMPVRRAIAALVVLVLATAVVPQLALGRPLDYSLLQSIFMASFAVGGVRLILMRNHQLFIARQQLTDLAVAEERLRVGRDVHDILGHSLTVITVKTELAQRLLDIDPERARAEMADVERLARESLAGVRTTVGGLREVSLAGELANARTALAAAEIAADLPETDDLPIRHSVVFGWVLREAVTNIVRHSGARHCWVRVTPRSIEIADDGVGMRESSRSGSGLSGLRERVRATGGTLTLGNRPEGGLRVLASFPAGTTQEPE